MLEPPERIRGNPERLKTWKPPVKRDIDWETVSTADGGKSGSVVGGPAVPQANYDEENPPDVNQEPKYLTIGLIGEPI